MTAGALQRTIRRAAQRSAKAECCGLCAGVVGAQHRHVLDEQDGSLLCACTPCSLLFERDAAGGGRYQLVPTRRTRLAQVPIERLDVPVGLAFFVQQRDGRVMAHYPSPLGTTEAELTAAAWRTVVAGSSALGELRPLVEGLMTWTGYRSGHDQQWIVPLDDCYRLVAVIRRSWKGMSGGSAVWQEVARFFADLERPHGPSRRPVEIAAR
jgi:Family of unknown function (DUF5947)